MELQAQLSTHPNTEQRWSTTLQHSSVILPFGKLSAVDPGPRRPYERNHCSKTLATFVGPRDL